MKHLYEPAVLDEVHKRIDELRENAEPRWGLMTAAQALAHCTRAMEYSLGEFTLPRHPLGRLIGGWVKRSLIVRGKPMRRNSPTHPSVLVQDQRNFEAERRRLHATLARFSTGGPSACTRHPHFFFGAMTPVEWAAFSYVHLDHHLRQFRV